MERSRLAKWLAEASEVKELEVFKAIVRQYRHLTDEDRVEREAQELADIFWRTLSEMAYVEKKGLSGRYYKGEGVKRKVTELRIASVSRKRYIPKRNERKLNQLEPYAPLITDLRGKGLSYRAIVDYLKRYHHVSVSESGLRKFMRKHIK